MINLINPLFNMYAYLHILFPTIYYILTSAVAFLCPFPLIIVSATQKIPTQRSFWDYQSEIILHHLCFLETWVSFTSSAIFKGPNGHSLELWVFCLVQCKGLFIIYDDVNNRHERDFNLRQTFQYSDEVEGEVSNWHIPQAFLLNLIFVVWKPFVSERMRPPSLCWPHSLTSCQTSTQREGKKPPPLLPQRERWLPRNAIEPVETESLLSWSCFWICAVFLS